LRNLYPRVRVPKEHQTVPLNAGSFLFWTVGSALRAVIAGELGVQLVSEAGKRDFAGGTHLVNSLRK
jgi:hypothetical protein